MKWSEALSGSICAFLVWNHDQPGVFFLVNVARHHTRRNLVRDEGRGRGGLDGLLSSLSCFIGLPPCFAGIAFGLWLNLLPLNEPSSTLSVIQARP